MHLAEKCSRWTVVPIRHYEWAPHHWVIFLKWQQETALCCADFTIVEKKSINTSAFVFNTFGWTMFQCNGKKNRLRIKCLMVCMVQLLSHILANVFSFLYCSFLMINTYVFCRPWVRLSILGAMFHAFRKVIHWVGFLAGHLLLRF